MDELEVETQLTLKLAFFLSTLSWSFREDQRVLRGSKRRLAPLWWGSIRVLSKGSLSQPKYHPFLIFSFKIPLSDSSCHFLPERQKHEDLTLNLYFPDLCIYFLRNLNFPLPCKHLKELLDLHFSGSFSWESIVLATPKAEALVNWERRLPIVQESWTNGTQLRIVLPDLNSHAIKYTLK